MLIRSMFFIFVCGTAIPAWGSWSLLESLSACLQEQNTLINVISPQEIPQLMPPLPKRLQSRGAEMPQPITLLEGNRYANQVVLSGQSATWIAVFSFSFDWLT